MINAVSSLPADIKTTEAARSQANTALRSHVRLIIGRALTQKRLGDLWPWPGAKAGGLSRP
jgi:hypothetical protein